MKNCVAILIVIFALSNACSQNNPSGKDFISTTSLSRQDSMSVDLKFTELVEAVLNLPPVIRYSKVEFIRRKHERIYVCFEEKVTIPNSFKIYQNGFEVEISNCQETFNKPCYVFKRIDMRETTASVSLNFDITGFISSGNLNYINGNWVPDKDFEIGYR